MPQVSKNKRLDKMPKKYRSVIEENLIELVSELRSRRTQIEMTQEELAEELNVHRTTVQALEQHRTRPSIELLLAWVLVLKSKIELK